MNEIEMEDIKEAVEGHKKEANIKKFSNDIVNNFKVAAKEQKNSKSYPIITNDNIIDQGKKVKFKVPINFLDHTEYLEYETTEAGLRHFKSLLDSNKDERARDQAEEIKNLSFYDGVILVWEIFERTIHDYFDEDDKDAFGYRYDLGLMDKMQDILSNEVLNKIENLRKEHLHELFIMKSDLYKRPAWMRSDKNCIDTKPNQKIVSMQQK